MCYSLCLLPLVISLFTSGKGFIISVHSDQVEEDSSKTTSLPSFLEVEQTWVSLPLRICLVLQPPTVLVALQWCCYNGLVLGIPYWTLSSKCLVQREEGLDLGYSWYPVEEGWQIMLSYKDTLSDNIVILFLLCILKQSHKLISFLKIYCAY